MYRLVVVFLGSISYKFTGNSFDGCVAGRIDIRYDTYFSIEKGESKLFIKFLSSGIQMRLKDRYYPPVLPTFAGSLERSLYLCGMMGIVINDQHAVLFSFTLESAKNTFKTFQPRFDLCNVNVQLYTDGYSS